MTSPSAVRSAASVADAKPEDQRAMELRSELKAPLAKGLFLWRKTKDDVLKEMDSELQMPGWGNAWTQPIINRVNMLATGVRTQIGVKVFGPTGKPMDQAIADIQRVTDEIATKLRTIRGAVDVVPDQSVGKRYLEIHIDRERAKRYGVNVSDIDEVVETAIGGDKITQTVEGRQRFPVVLRYPREYWQDIDAIGNILVSARTTPAELLPLSPGKGGGAAGPAPASPPAPASSGMGSSAGRAMGGGGAAGAMSGGASGMSGDAMGRAASGRSSGLIGSVQPTANSGLQIPLRMVADIRFVDGPNAIKAKTAGCAPT